MAITFYRELHGLLIIYHLMVLDILGWYEHIVRGIYYEARVRGFVSLVFDVDGFGDIAMLSDGSFRYITWRKSWNFEYLDIILVTKLAAEY